MSARILSPDRLAERRPSQEPTLVEALLDRAGGVFSWQGASGQRYAHSIFSLIECPPLPKVAYALVRRDAAGARHVLHIASGTSDAPTLNLARIRSVAPRSAPTRCTCTRWPGPTTSATWSYATCAPVSSAHWPRSRPGRLRVSLPSAAGPAAFALTSKRYRNLRRCSGRMRRTDTGRQSPRAGCR
jgi:hypothetical protein